MLRLADLRYRDDLVDRCRESQGEYLDAWHPKTSWATTYSNQFVDAVVELYALHVWRGYREPLAEVSKLLIEAGIRSCRGSVMNDVQMKYLEDTYGISKRAATLKKRT